MKRALSEDATFQALKLQCGLHLSTFPKNTRVLNACQSISRVVSTAKWPEKMVPNLTEHFWFDTCPAPPPNSDSCCSPVPEPLPQQKITVPGALDSHSNSELKCFVQFMFFDARENDTLHKHFLMEVPPSQATSATTHLQAS
jgi:hypothetical protein